MTLCNSFLFGKIFLFLSHMGVLLSGRAFDCRSRGPQFKPGRPLQMFLDSVDNSIYRSSIVSDVYICWKNSYSVNGKLSVHL